MQDILIHVRSLEARTPAARFGVRLAARLHASVTAIFPCPEPVYVAPAFEPEALMAALTETMRQLVQNAAKARQPFVTWATSEGAVRAQWLIARGPMTDALAQASNRHDLLVLDHGDVEKDSPRDIPGIVLKVGIPCIVVPSEGVRSAEFARVAVAWNASPEAMRAIHAALPLLRGAHVLLLSGEDNGRYRGVTWEPPFNICEYLRQHGVMVELRTIDATPEDVGRVLLEESADFHADLLVMGAYGRSRFSEWMLGGATRHVLTWADIPVLMQH